MISVGRKCRVAVFFTNCRAVDVLLRRSKARLRHIVCKNNSPGVFKNMGTVLLRVFSVKIKENLSDVATFNCL